MVKYELKYSRPNIRENGHTKILIDGEEYGYFLPNRSPYSTVGHNWTLVLPNKSIPCSNRKQVLFEIENHFLDYDNKQIS